VEVCIVQLDILERRQPHDSHPAAVCPIATDYCYINLASMLPLYSIEAFIIMIERICYFAIQCNVCEWMS
jgi:hypothetical protein